MRFLLHPIGAALTQSCPRSSKTRNESSFLLNLGTRSRYFSTLGTRRYTDVIFGYFNKNMASYNLFIKYRERVKTFVCVKSSKSDLFHFCFSFCS